MLSRAGRACLLMKACRLVGHFGLEEEEGHVGDLIRL